MAKQYFRDAARIVNIPWSIAVGGDFAYPDTKGKKPFGTDLLNRYMDRVIHAGQVDDDVVIRFNEVVSLVRSPQALLAPSFVLRVLALARRADRARRDQHTTASSEPATTLDVHTGHAPHIGGRFAPGRRAARNEVLAARGRTATGVPPRTAT